MSRCKSSFRLPIFFCLQKYPFATLKDGTHFDFYDDRGIKNRNKFKPSLIFQKIFGFQSKLPTYYIVETILCCTDWSKCNHVLFDYRCCLRLTTIAPRRWIVIGAIFLTWMTFSDRFGSKQEGISCLSFHVP